MKRSGFLGPCKPLATYVFLLMDNHPKIYRMYVAICKTLESCSIAVRLNIVCPSGQFSPVNDVPLGHNLLSPSVNNEILKAEKLSLHGCEKEIGGFLQSSYNNHLGRSVVKL